jgi:carnitine-CoA ligase
MTDRPTALAERTLTATLRQATDKEPERLAVCDKHRKLTYRQVWESARRFAGGFRSLGIERQERVLLMLDNHVDMVLCWAGLTFNAAVEVPVNTALRGGILQRVIGGSGARLAVVDEQYADRFAEAAGDTIETVVIRRAAGQTRGLQGTCGGVGRKLVAFESLAAGDACGPVPVDPWDLVTLMYTSGTTGTSKGVMIPHAALHSTSESWGNLRPGDVHFIALPLFHNAAKSGVYATMMAGATAYIAEKFSASEFWAEARAAGATSTQFIGPMPEFLLRQDPSPEDGRHEIRQAYMVPVIKRYDEFRRRFNVNRILTVYGSTEIGTATFDNEGTSPQPGRVGTPSPLLEFKLVDEHDLDVEDGQAGEAVVRPREPWLLMAGYQDQSAANMNAWRNGWFHTGDALYRDGDGAYHFVDRLRDRIRRRGENISSAEVEGEVNSHPDVLETAAVAIPNELGEDDVKVAVILRAGAGLTEEQLARYLVDRMPYFMVPRYIEFVDELPRTPNLKVRKEALRAVGIGNGWDRENAGIVARK